jgi:hypothetical protein
MGTPATIEKPATAKLIAAPADAIRHLRALLDRGGEIKALRVRNGEDLDKARGHKLEWTQDAADLLNSLFDNTTVADYFNDWVGKIFPEYAEFGNFVDQFYEEMDQRLAKLRAVLKRIETASEPVAAVTPAPADEPPNNSENAVNAANLEPVMPSSHKVLFVSHGPKDPSSEAVLQFIQQLSLPVVEADHTNGLIETLDGRNDTGFVIVMNAIDHGDAKSSLSEHSMFKLGYCAGKLGLKRMCMMHGPTHAPLNDSHGISHTPVDVNGGWQLHLARQMKRAGVEVDLNRLA